MALSKRKTIENEEYVDKKPHGNISLHLRSLFLRLSELKETSEISQDGPMLYEWTQSP